ncbi:DNA polymerase III subunit gamma/tau [Mesomycoplasma hyorhinis]|uniref:DNA polymerase III subunit gamma/tau n=1 Tax=Mesomycoplasma hyorhinis TaxID=2100 RepID=UPI001C04704B|nr:DNA polymerase III subunit gamma/tau [Mesomycoplasma hyorhinis]
MSKNYLAFYRKYRPTTLVDVVGQDFIIQTLKNIISTNQIFHAYLFSGPRGTGKTSVAKIFATTLNCSHKTDLFIPCQKCQDSVNNSFDIIEMDGASNNGVDEIRELINNVNNLPTNSQYKIYIIDEVHMLSSSAFNAFLKTLEEPPKHVIFILATTEAHKIPLTILSRVQRFNFRKISEKEIVSRLEYVLEKEEISYEKEALWAIAQLSSGSLRDALAMVEQLNNFSRSKIHMIDVENLFGLTSTQKLINLLKEIHNENLQQIFHLISTILEQGANPNILISSLISLVKNFIIYQKTKDITLLEGFSVEQIEKIPLSLLTAYKLQDVLVKTQKELISSNNPAMSIQIAIIKLFAVAEKSNDANSSISGFDARDLHIKRLYEAKDLKANNESVINSIKDISTATELATKTKNNYSWSNPQKPPTKPVVEKLTIENTNPLATNSWKEDFQTSSTLSQKIKNINTQEEHFEDLGLLNEEELVEQIKNNLDTATVEKTIAVNNPQGMSLFDYNEADQTNSETEQPLENTASILENQEFFNPNDFQPPVSVQEAEDYLTEEEIYNLFRIYIKEGEPAKSINAKLKQQWNDKLDLATASTEFSSFAHLLKTTKIVVSSSEFILISNTEENNELENLLIKEVKNNSLLSRKLLEYMFQTPMHLFVASNKLSQKTISNWKANSATLKSVQIVPLAKINADSLNDENRLSEIFPNKKRKII